jgi:hypothetical protein
VHVIKRVQAIALRWCVSLTGVVAVVWCETSTDEMNTEDISVSLIDACEVCAYLVF